MSRALWRGLQPVAGADELVMDQMTGGSELARLTQEKTLNDVQRLLPSMLVGLDVNVRFHK